MSQKEFIVEGRQFRTKSDYVRALHDRKIIEELRKNTDFQNSAALEERKKELESGSYSFMTILGEDFKDEINEALLKIKREGVASGNRRMSKRTGMRGVNPQNDTDKTSAEMNVYIQKELKNREKRRKIIIVLCSIGASFCLGYVGLYSWFNQRTESSYQKLSELKEQPVIADTTPAPLFTLDEQPQPKEVLDEYKNLLNKNKRLIGWLKIDDTNIDYPVMQTTDNAYYLDHNMNQEYDKNGSIFMDKDCDVLKPCTNYIVYGHHMRSGNMFGKLHLYEDEEYCKEHSYIQFDTIYEKGTYEVMYVFRSRVYSEEEIVFKYYQFIDANSEQEFNSYMNEMESIALYDTGVRAEYGDQLLTLSTCDYQEKNGRFVVVAKKIKE